MRRLLPLLALLLLTSGARAQTWEPIHANLGIAGTVGTDYLVNVTGFDGTYLYANVAHTAQLRYRFFRSTDQGTTWTEMPGYAAAGGAGGQVIASYNGRLYVPQSTGGALLYSDNQGQTWTSVAGANMQNASAVARVGTNVVVTLGSSGLLRRSTDGGATWTNGSTLLLAVDSNGSVFTAINAGTQLVRSTDGGATWTPVTVAGAFAFTSLWHVGTTLYAKALIGGVVTSTDNGATWTSVSTAATPAFGYVYPTASGSAWLLVDAPAQGTTVAFTRDRGTTITNASATYPKLSGSATTLCTSNFSATADYAIANAWQCSLSGPGAVGLYRLRMTTGVANEPGLGAGALTLTLGPNPTAGRLAVRAAGLGDVPVRLAVYDARGRLVATLHDGPALAVLTADADVRAWAPGVYLVRLVAGEAVVTRALVVH